MLSSRTTPHFEVFASNTDNDFEMCSSKETLMLSCFSCAGPIFKSRLKNTGCIHHEMPCVATLTAPTIHRGEEGGTPADLRKPFPQGPGRKLWDGRGRGAGGVWERLGAFRSVWERLELMLRGIF